MRPWRAKRVLAALLALLPAACGETPVAEALRGLRPAAEPAPTIPPGPVLVVTGHRRPLVFTPVQETGPRRLWRAEGGVALATEGPRIVATAGFGQILAATRLEGPDPLEDVAALLDRPATARRVVDLADASRDPAGMRFGLVIECRLSAMREPGSILVTEACTSPAGAFTNRFRADPATLGIRGSEQWVGDEVPMVTMEMR